VGLFDSTELMYNFSRRKFRKQWMQTSLHQLKNYSKIFAFL